jgi:hypothetical protein
MDSREPRMDHWVSGGDVAGATIAAAAVCIATIVLAVMLIDINRLSAGIPLPTGALSALSSLLTG